MHHVVGAGGDNVFLDERLDGVGDGLQQAEWAHAVGAVPVLDTAYAFALKKHNDSKKTGKGAYDGDGAEYDAACGAQCHGQIADEPVAEDDEDLVEIGK